MSTATPPLTEQNLSRLPAPILGKLRQLIRRIRRIAILKGIFAVIATALICLLSIMAIDASLTIFSPAIRWSLTLTALGVTLAAAWWWILRPATKRITLTSIARMVEKRHPELQETISSSVELLSSDDPDEMLGSRELIDEVVRTAERDVSSVSPRKEFDASPVRSYALAALGFAGILTIVILLWPKPASVLMVRAVAPFLEMGNAYADTMVVEPGDAIVSVGSDLEISMSIQHPKLERATVRRLDVGASKEGVERMNLADIDGENVRTFTQTFPNLQGDLQYRVHAGNAVSRYFNVTVVDLPAVEELRIRYDYPEYTGLAAREEVSETGEIIALENTLVTVTALTNRPMRSIAMTIGGEPQNPVAFPDKPDSNTEKTWQFYLKRDQETTWSLRLVDEHGFENQEESHPLRAVRDGVPRVAITAPGTTELKLKPTEILPVLYEAREDYGFSSVTLVTQAENSDTSKDFEQALPALASPGLWNGRAALNLGSLDLEDVRELKVWVKVADNLPEQHYGPQTAVSQPITIIIDRRAKSLVQQVFDAQEQEIRKELSYAKQDLRKAQGSEAEARKRMERDKELSDEAMDKLERAREELTAAEDRIRKLADKMEDTIFADRAEEMKQVNAEDIQPARQKGEEIPLTDDQDTRLELAENMETEIEEALENVDKVLENLEESEKDLDRIADLTEMAQEQQRLAMEAAEAAQKERELQASLSEMSETDQKRASEQQARELAEWKNDQEEVLKNLADLLKEDPEAASQVLEQQERNALKLADEASELAKNQEALKNATEMASDPQQFEQLQEDLLEQLEKMQQQIADEGQELKQEFAKNNPESQQSAQAMSDAAKQADDAAEELRRKDLADAREKAQEAAEGFEKLAQEAAEVTGQESAAKYTEQMAQEGEVPSPEEWMQENPDGTPTDPDSAANFTQQMAEASKQDGNQSSQDASEQAAGEQGEQMAQQGQPQPQDTGASGEMPNTDLPPDAKLASDLANLNQRQQALAKTMESVEKGQLEEAMAQIQESISADARTLEEKAKALEMASALNAQQEAKAQADQAQRNFAEAEKKSLSATNSLKQAQEQQDKAQAQALQEAAESQGMSPSEAQQAAMSQAQNGQAPPAQPTSSEMSNLNSSKQLQQQSQDALEKAAQGLAQAAQKLQDQARSLAPTQEAEGKQAAFDPQELAQSFENVSQASQARDSAQAAAQSQQAATALQKMSAQVAEKMGANSSMFADAELQQNGQASMQTAVPTDSQARDSTTMATDSLVFGEGEALPAEIEQLGISSMDWARIQGSLNAEITNQATSGAPQEYQSLVDQYFRMMAAEAQKE